MSEQSSAFRFGFHRCKEDHARSVDGAGAAEQGGEVLSKDARDSDMSCVR